MIRGATIFGAGVAVGCAKADEIKTFVTELQDAWKQASTKAKNDLSPEGVDYLLDRLREALPHAADISNDETIIGDKQGEPKLTMGDLRAPFPNIDEKPGEIVG